MLQLTLNFVMVCFFINVSGSIAEENFQHRNSNDEVQNRQFSKNISIRSQNINNYVMNKNRQKRSALLSALETTNVTETLYSAVIETGKKLSEFEKRLLELENETMESNQQLKRNLIPRLESIENQLSNKEITATTMDAQNSQQTGDLVAMSVDCEQKNKERFEKFSNFSEEPYKNREQYRQELTEWSKIVIFCKFPINSRYGKTGQTLLHFAAKADAVDIAKFLIANKALVDSPADKKITPLHLAAKYNSVNVVQLLIEKKANLSVVDSYKRTALFYAAATDAVEIAQILIDNNAEVNFRDIIGTLPIHNAARTNSINVLNLLLEHRAPVDAKSFIGTPLSLAADEDAVDAAQILLENGAKIKGTIFQEDTAVHSAAKANATRVLQLLIKYKAPLNNGDVLTWTPLHWAASKNALAAAKLLIENGADVNVLNNFDNTALHIATENKAIQVMEYLLQNKVLVNAKNFAGNTAYQIARSIECKECMTLLKRYGART